MKVVLVELPFYTLLERSTYNFMLGLGYIASSLEQTEHSVSIVNGEALKLKAQKQLTSLLLPIQRLRLLVDNSLVGKQLPFLQEVMTTPSHPLWDTMIKNIADQKPDLIGLGLVTVKMTAAKLICQRIKKDIGNTLIVVGGPHPTALPLETLEQIPEVDYVVMGEGEETMKELCQYLNAPTTNGLHSIKGIAHRGKLGREPTINQPRELIQDLDSLPFPKRENPETLGYEKVEAIITGRGCPYQCKFCASNIAWRRRARYRSIDDVIEEIAMLKAHSGVKHIRIVDDTFPLSKRRVLEFSQKVKQDGLDNIEYSVGSRVDTIDEEMLAALRACNVTHMTFGVESGSPRILQQICKDITPEQVRRVMTLAKAAGISSHAFYMIGHPGETKQDIQMSKKLLSQSKSDSAELNMVTIYPKTGYAEAAIQRGKKLPSINESYRGFHQGNPIVNLTELTDKELQDEYVSFARLIMWHNSKNLLPTLVKKLKQPRRILKYLFGS